jgi:NH3-dependent NAD+ synthetase
VLQLARLLDIPEKIMHKTPTNGLQILSDGTTPADEAEMGMLSDEIETATRLFMEFGADLEALTAAVKERFPDNAEQVLTVCKGLGSELD